MDCGDLNKMWLGKSGDPPHPALWHMLDVAAVAQEIQKHRPVHSDPNVCNAITALIGLHDLGKISESFRNMLTKGHVQTSSARHWRITGYYFCEFEQELMQWLGKDYEVITPVLLAVICHHGDFSNAIPDFDPDSLAIGEQAREDAGTIIDFFASLFPSSGFQSLISKHDNEPRAEIISLHWKVSGLVVQSDWIGSNADWFPPTQADMPVMDYWVLAQSRAQKAVECAGLFEAIVSDSAAEGVLGADVDLRPMQKAVSQCALADEPTLYVVEDMTGAGKTEAALMLAKRLLQAGQGKGIFFALPSMATSNAIYERLQPIVPKIFDGHPQTALTHSKSGLNTTYQAARNDESDSETTCSAWLSYGRRQVLFADVAVGTIDQALMGILPTRFNTLRQWALSNKILIIDEAHSYDPYMEVELQALLKFHQSFGGSAILMTATLPSAMKQKFIEIYGETSQGLQCDYPQLTSVNSTSQVTPVDPVPENIRTVGVVRLDSKQGAIRQIKQAVAAGAAVAWVRNAVDDAIEAVKLLQQEGIDADLLHARFTMGDRLEKEIALQNRFGKQGTDRAGRVVVATQVIEQSLDLDFDVMISDLAPIGYLIQRAGRLWRHRTRQERPVDVPTLYVLSPDPDAVSSSEWLSSVLDRGVYVYDKSTQWRTARAIFDAGCINEPDGLRALIDQVHNGEIPVPLPLKEDENKAEGNRNAEKGLARGAVLCPTRQIDQRQNLHDDEQFQTRLGQPQKTLCLAKRVGGVLVPFNESWPLSEVSISCKKVEDIKFPETSEIETIKQEWPRSRREYITLVEVKDDESLAGLLTYSNKYGLSQGFPA